MVRLVAASLVAALTTGPVILDACMFSCHGSNDSAAGEDTERSEPSCHQVSEDADARLEPPPASCGHDHSPTPSTMTAQQRDADGRCDLGFGVWVLPDVQHDAQLEFRIARPSVSDTRSCRGASPPLRV